AVAIGAMNVAVTSPEGRTAIPATSLPSRRPRTTASLAGSCAIAGFPDPVSLLLPPQPLRPIRPASSPAANSVGATAPTRRRGGSVGIVVVRVVAAVGPDLSGFAGPGDREQVVAVAVVDLEGGVVDAEVVIEHRLEFAADAVAVVGSADEHV